MNNRIRAIALLLTVLITVSVCYETRAGGVLRLHVIANSDAPDDQQLKLKVRDAILDFERTRLSGCKDNIEARAALMRNGSELISTVENVLIANGRDYGVQLMIGNYVFPEREYGYITYPEGEYEALKVVLGEGKGQNWWCVIFPPLCIVDWDGKGELPKELKFKSAVYELILKIMKHKEDSE